MGLQGVKGSYRGLQRNTKNDRRCYSRLKEKEKDRNG